MKILLKQATIVDPLSPFHGQIADILIEKGIITKIASGIIEKNLTEIEAKGHLVSPGWVDPFAHLGDPGFEFRETLETGAQAAAAGGYTHVFVLPNTSPVIDSKTQAEYIRQQSGQLPVHLYPLGAITKGCEGKELAEMYDMRNSGAIAFSDGLQAVQSPGLFLKALQYVKAFDGVLLQIPVDKSISSGGLMHEGIISTRLGLPGIPAIGEEIMIKRDIELLRYTQSRLHITGVSTRNGLQLIRAASNEGLQISCSVTPYHLYFCDEDLQTYDTNLKLSPPLRSKKDMMALREALVAGEVDCIATHHLPQDWDHKHCEFEYAKNGMTGLETAFAVINDLFPALPDEQLVNLFSGNARNIFHLPSTNISIGADATLSICNRKGKTMLTRKNTHSKSVNTPFLEKELRGSVTGIICKGKMILNQH